MDKKLIQVGKVYMAQHAGQLVKVRVDDIRVIEGVKIFNRPSLTRYYCTKLKTNRQVIFKSAQKFKMFVTPDEGLRIIPPVYDSNGKEEPNV